MSLTAWKPGAWKVNAWRAGSWEGGNGAPPEQPASEGGRRVIGRNSWKPRNDDDDFLLIAIL